MSRAAITAIALLIGACGSPTPSGYQPIQFGQLPGNGNGGTADSGAGGADGAPIDRLDTGGTAQDGVTLDGASGGADDATSGDDAGTGGGDTAGVPDTGTGGDALTDGGASEDTGTGDGGALPDILPPLDIGGTPDSSTTPDSATEDGVLADTGAVDDIGGGGSDTVGGGGSGDPFGADVPWGSEEDATPYDAGPVGYPDAGAGGSLPQICTPKIGELNLKEEKVGGKVDVIWWIDTSGSMGQEAAYLNQNINAFANFIGNANIDFRMILVGNSTSCCKICVAPPLGGPNCTDGPQFKHIKQTIGSKNGHSVLVSSYSKWKSFLRPDATKNFVAVTDDNSNQSAAWFMSQIKNIDPVQFKPSPEVPHGFVYHSIVAYNSSSDCPTIASKGTVYLDLTAQTNGAKFKICEKNWAPIFQSLANSVVQTAKPGCTYKVPFPAGVGASDKFGVSYVAKDDLFDVPKAPNNVCPSNGVGFTVDNPNAPKEMTLCSSSCNLLKGGGNIQFDFGCF